MLTRSFIFSRFLNPAIWEPRPSAGRYAGRCVLQSFPYPLFKNWLLAFKTSDISNEFLLVLSAPSTLKSRHL